MNIQPMPDPYEEARRIRSHLEANGVPNLAEQLMAGDAKGVPEPTISNEEMMAMLDKQHAYMDDLAARRQAGDVAREPWCICSDEYWERALDDPACRHDEIGLRQAQIDALRAQVELLRNHRFPNVTFASLATPDD